MKLVRQILSSNNKLAWLFSSPKNLSSMNDSLSLLVELRPESSYLYQGY